MTFLGNNIPWKKFPWKKNSLKKKFLGKNFLAKKFLGIRIPWKKIPWNAIPWKNISLLGRIALRITSQVNSITIRNRMSAGKVVGGLVYSQIQNSKTA